MGAHLQVQRDHAPELGRGRNNEVAWKPDQWSDRAESVRRHQESFVRTNNIVTFIQAKVEVDIYESEDI